MWDRAQCSHNARMPLEPKQGYQRPRHEHRTSASTLMQQPHLGGPPPHPQGPFHPQHGPPPFGYHPFPPPPPGHPGFPGPPPGHPGFQGFPGHPHQQPFPPPHPPGPAWGQPHPIHQLREQELDLPLPPGTALVEELDQRVLIQLRDGRKLLGILRSFDQFANLVIEGAVERIIVGDQYGDIPMGLHLIRGENVVLFGRLDPEKEVPANLTRVSEKEIRQAVKGERELNKLKATLRARMDFLVSAHGSGGQWSDGEPGRGGRGWGGCLA